MLIGTSILVGAIGAILRYAVADEVDNVDLRMVGLILMIAAAVGLVVGLVQMMTRRRIVTEVREVPTVRQVPRAR
jgi:energy-converting hydrogenase Eha subunit C